MSPEKYIEVCFSPALFPVSYNKGDIVVVIDVLRASSSIAVAIHTGVEKIVPVAGIEECLKYREQGFLIAGERKGIMVPGFDLGNSPFAFMSPDLKGRNIAMTTTNGTQAVQLAKMADKVVFGCFLNLDSLVSWLKTQNKNVICLCAGWENKFSMEDSLFAGALVYHLKGSHGLSVNCDSAIAAEHLYMAAKNDLYKFLENSSHRKRLEKLNIQDDVKYCLSAEQLKVIPIMENDAIVNLIENSLVNDIASYSDAEKK